MLITVYTAVCYCLCTCAQSRGLALTAEAVIEVDAVSGVRLRTLPIDSILNVVDARGQLQLQRAWGDTAVYYMQVMRNVLLHILICIVCTSVDILRNTSL
jgi:hypothetical protein